MREGIALAVIQLIMLGILWLVMAVVGLVVAAKTKQAKTRILAVCIGLGGVPAYLVGEALLRELGRKIESESGKVRLAKWAGEFARLCAQPTPPIVSSVVDVKAPVDIRIREGTLGGLDILTPGNQGVLGAQSLCWLTPGSPNCARPPIANVETSFPIPFKRECEGLGSNPAKRTSECFNLWRFSTESGERFKIGELTAPYELVVWRPSSSEFGYYRFKIELFDVRTSTSLGHTYILKTSHPELAATQRARADPYHCPSIESGVTTLLRSVFVPAR